MGPMWGTFLLEVYRQQHARDVRDAMERVRGPEPASSWSTGAVYVFWNPYLDLDDHELIELNEALSAEALDEIRALEGRMIALYAQQFGKPLRWNESLGRVPPLPPDAEDGTLATAVGMLDCLVQARKTIRRLAEDGEAMIFEEHLHGARLGTVRDAILDGGGFNNTVLRRHLEEERASSFLADAILTSGYLDQRNPVTIGPMLDPPEDDQQPPPRTSGAHELERRRQRPSLIERTRALQARNLPERPVLRLIVANDRREVDELAPGLAVAGFVLWATLVGVLPPPQPRVCHRAFAGTIRPSRHLAGRGSLRLVWTHGGPAM